MAALNSDFFIMPIFQCKALTLIVDIFRKTTFKPKRQGRYIPALELPWPCFCSNLLARAKNLKIELLCKKRQKMFENWL